ncbi:MAG TPA: MFS transporter, partial [Agromyces sp.]|nr:MFS transporter [Agromyces sp.]
TLSVAGFAAAALLPVPALVVTGLILGGIGAGGAVAASGAALAAFVNPERVAGVSGLANRGVVTVILAIVPLVGLAPISVFGVLALFSLAMLFTSMWLPAAPVPVAAPVAASTAEPGASADPEASAAARRVTIAGFGLLVCFALWAASEDSLWAMAGFMGAEQAGLTAEGLGLALSGATAAGLVGAVLLMIVGERLGRAVPLAVLLVAGGLLKIVEGYVTDPTSFIVIFIAWNAVYAIAFMYFVATASGLDADGRWSGPLFAVYLVGSALTPVIGAALVEVFGFEGFTLVLGVSSFVLAVPAFAIARLSSRIERRADASSARSAETEVPTDTDADTLEAGAAR